MTKSTSTTFVSTNPLLSVSTRSNTNFINQHSKKCAQRQSNRTRTRTYPILSVATPPPPARDEHTFSPLTPPRQLPQICSQSELSDALITCRRRLAILKVYSHSCRSCGRIARPFARMAELRQNEIACFETCIDDHPQFAQTLGVRAMPTFIIFVDGKRMDHFANSNIDVIAEHIEDYL